MQKDHTAGPGRSWGAGIAIILLLLFSPCSEAASPPPPKQKSVTRLPKGKAALLKYFSNTDRKLGKASAFYSLGDPRDAFIARIFLIDHATTSLDVQYYIYEDDVIGNFFTHHLMMAAERGVKVRILLDDLITGGKDKKLAMITAHPNIELRLFNPNHFRKTFRNLALLFDVNSLGKRMHNKSLIADGAVAIIGGRNIGDVYYAADKETLFLDYDILAIGKVVPDIYHSFDLYWNSKEAVPSSQVIDDLFTLTEYNKELEARDKSFKAFKQSTIGKAMASSDFSQKIVEGKIKLTVVKRADLYYDYPEKVRSNEEDTRTHLSSRISYDLKHVERELIIISPYFIPSEEFMAKLKALRERGASVTVVTNSLASTDVFPVYSGYRWSIESLVQMGVHLYELKPQSFKKFTRSRKWLKGHRTSLHTKMMVIDRDRLVVGSANIDPRSDKLNTELVLVISSEKMAKEKLKVLKEIINEENFYRLSWGRDPSAYATDDISDYGPIWHTIENGKEKTYYSPPRSGFFRTLGTDLLSFLPIEGYL